MNVMLRNELSKIIFTAQQIMVNLGRYLVLVLVNAGLNRKICVLKHLFNHKATCDIMQPPLEYNADKNGIINVNAIILQLFALNDVKYM